MQVARLPTELYEAVVDFLRDDVRTIRHCALVSKAWHVRSQLWLYHTIQVIDDIVGDFDYIKRRTPYITTRMRNFVPFVDSADPRTSYIRRLRIACFWHDDEGSWSDYVSTWLGLQMAAHLKIEHLQVYVASQQNMGSLLQALALHFPNVVTLDLHGTFAEPSDMATCISAFSSVRSLTFEWDGVMRSAVREVWLATPQVLPRPPFAACRLTVDLATLPLMLRWFSADYTRVKCISVDNLSPARHARDIDDLADELLEMPYLERIQIRGLHITAVDGGTVSTASWRRTQRAVRELPRLAYIKFSTSYTADTETEDRIKGLKAVPGSHAYDPIHQITHMFTIRWNTERTDERYTAHSLQMLVIELQLPAADISALLHHNWAMLDRTFSSDQWSNVHTLVVSVCLTECEDVGMTRDVARFIRSSMRACDKLGLLSVRTSHVPPQCLKKRSFIKEGTILTEEGFVRFSRTDFADSGLSRLIDTFLPSRARGSVTPDRD